MLRPRLLAGLCRFSVLRVLEAPRVLEAELFVRNLDSASTEADVRAIFAAKCTVRHVRIPLDRETKEPRGFAFVTVEASEVDVKAEAVRSAMDGSLLQGRSLKVTSVYNSPLATANALAKLPAKTADEEAALKVVERRLIEAERAGDIIAIFEVKGSTFEPVHFAAALWRIGFLGRSRDTGFDFATRDRANLPLLHLLLDEAAKSVAAVPESWTPRNLCDAVWGIAKVGDAFKGKPVYAPELFEAVRFAVSQKKAKKFSTPDVANLVWAFATAGFSAPALFQAFASEATKKVKKLHLPALGNVAWAFSKMRFEAPALFAAIADQVHLKIDSINHGGLAKLAWAFSEAGYAAKHGQLFVDVSVAARKSIHTFDSADLAMIVFAFAKAGIHSPALFEAVAEEAPRKMKKFKTFTPANVADATWAFATFGIEAPALFESCAKVVRKKTSAFTPSEMATTLTAFSAMHHPAPYQAAALEVFHKLEDFEARDLAKLLRAFSAARMEARKLFEKAALEALKKIETFEPKDFADTAWAYANAGVEAPLLFEAVAAETLKNIDLYEPHDLANVAWALSKAPCPAPVGLRDLFEKIAEEAPNRVDALTPVDLANIVWAIAKAGVAAPLLFQAAEATWLKKMAIFDPPTLATISQAYSSAGVEAPLLFEAVALEAVKKMMTFDAQSLAVIVSAYAAVEASEAKRDLFDAVAAEAVKKVWRFNSEELANTARAYATAQIAAPALFEAIAAQAGKTIATLNAQALANTVWAFAKAGVEAPLLFEAVSAYAPEKLTTFNSQELAETAWAFAAVGGAELFRDMAPIFVDKLSQSSLDDFSPKALAQLHHVYVHLRLAAPWHILHPLTVALNRKEADLRGAYLSAEPRPSPSRLDFAAALNRLGWAHELDHVIPQGIRLDFADPALKVAVEFDGPGRHLVGASDAVSCPRVLDGTAKFKEKLLRGAGWDLVRVPYFEWDALRTNEQQDAYLRSKVS